MVKMSKFKEKNVKKSILIYNDFQESMKEAKGVRGVIGRIKEELMEKYDITSIMTINKYIKLGEKYDKNLKNKKNG